MNTIKNALAAVLILMAVFFTLFLSCSHQPGFVQNTGSIADFMQANKDFYGVLEINGLLREPVVRGNDNSYYLSHSFDGAEDRNGCLFVDEAYMEGSMNLVIYGHNSFNGTAFSDLSKYKNPGFIPDHLRISLTKKDGTCSGFRIAMILNYSTDDIITCDPYETELPPDHLSRCRKYARYYIDEDIRTDAGSHFLTLSTCDETIYGTEGRLVIIAVREDDSDAEEK